MMKMFREFGALRYFRFNWTLLTRNKEDGWNQNNQDPRDTKIDKVYFIYASNEKKLPIWVFQLTSKNNEKKNNGDDDIFTNENLHMPSVLFVLSFHFHSLLKLKLWLCNYKFHKIPSFECYSEVRLRRYKCKARGCNDVKKKCFRWRRNNMNIRFCFTINRLPSIILGRNILQKNTRLGRICCLFQPNFSTEFI